MIEDIEGDKTDAAELADITPEEWLSEPEDKVFGRVTLHNGKTMKVAAITQNEYVAMQKLSTRVGLDPRFPHKMKTDTELFARRIICHAINKANGKSDVEGIQPEALGTRLTGNLIALQKQILKLSGIDDSVLNRDRDDDFLA